MEKQLLAMIYITNNFIIRMNELVTTEQQKNELNNFTNALNLIVSNIQSSTNNKKEDDNSGEKKL